MTIVMIPSFSPSSSHVISHIHDWIRFTHLKHWPDDFTMHLGVIFFLFDCDFDFLFLCPNDPLI